MRGSGEGPSFHPGSGPFRTCLGCKWLNHSLFMSGLEPVYEDRCTCPVLMRVPAPILPVLSTWSARGEYIGRDQPPRTPHWCPVLKES